MATDGGTVVSALDCSGTTITWPAATVAFGDRVEHVVTAVPAAPDEDVALTAAFTVTNPVGFDPVTVTDTSVCTDSDDGGGDAAELRDRRGQLLDLVGRQLLPDRRAMLLAQREHQRGSALRPRIFLEFGRLADGGHHVHAGAGLQGLLRGDARRTRHPPIIEDGRRTFGGSAT